MMKLSAPMIGLRYRLHSRSVRTEDVFAFGMATAE